MSNQNTFGNFLRYLIGFTASKSKEISECTAYDPSYISKWINHKSLPAKDEIDTVIAKLSEFFTNKIIAYGLEKKISDLVPKNVAIEENVIRISISNKFYKTFYESAGYSENSVENDILYISQPLNVFRETVKYINRQVILNNSDVLEVYICLNILEMCDNANMDSFLYFTENKSSVKVHLLLKEMDFRYWKEKRSSYISILFSLLLYNANIYYEGDIYLDNFIYFKKGGLMSYKFDTSGYAYYMDVVHEQFIMDKVLYTCYRQFDENNLLFKSSNEASIENAAILNAYLNKKTIYMLLSSFSWLFYL